MAQKSTQIIATLLLFFAALNNSCLADVKFGMGIFVNPSAVSFTSGITIPIKFGDHFILEPAFGVFKYKTETSGQSYNASDLNRYKDYSLGLYGVSKIKKNFDWYYGARFGTEDFLYEDVDTRYGTNEYITKTVFISPTLGVSYLVNSNFSISLDMGLYIYKGKEEDTYKENDASQPNIEKTESSGIETNANLIFRYMF